MGYKSILTVWDGRDESRATMDLAIRLVAANDGHLNVLCLGIDRIQPSLYYAGVSPKVINDNITHARSDAKSFEYSAKEILCVAALNWSTRAMVAQISSITYEVAAAARFNDLVILPTPYSKTSGEGAAAVLESALFSGHAPVLVCPETVGPELGKRIIIAWNQSAEALSAIRAAMPLLEKAEAVDVTVVDPGRHGEAETDPGIRLATMLSRHGVNVGVSVLARTMAHVTEVLERHASDFDADMLVMGAYGHSRFRESILGGATHDILRKATLPVLMAH